MATRRTVAKNVAALPPVMGQGVVDTPTMRPVPHPKAGSPMLGSPDAPRRGRTAAADSLPGVLQRIALQMRGRLRKDTVGWMHDTINPLWNITSRQAQAIFDLARSGNYAQLEYLYNEIENSSPVFTVCVTRRASALSELEWKVVRSDERLNRNADAGLVKEQIECLETAIARIDNLPEAMEHFALAPFRGFSVASVWRDASGMPTHLECLDHWNVCRDLRAGKWLWNPGAVSFLNPTLGKCDLAEIPPEDSVSIIRKRQIDWPAIKIYLREAIGERDWGRFLETYGLPPVVIKMPEYTSKEDENAYVEAAAAIYEGRNGALPYGAEVNFASDSRGVNPFSEFIEHQMKSFVLLATGGTLTSLAEATGIGSGASETQMDVWRQIVRADVRIVSNAMNKQLCERIIKSQRDFRGKPVLAEFKFDTEPRMTAKEAVEMASSLSSAGFEMDAEELSQLTGLKIRKKPDGGGMGFNAKPAPNKPPSPNGGVDTSLSDPGIVTQTGPTGEVVHKAENADPPQTAAEGAGMPRGEVLAIKRAVMPPDKDTRPEPSLAAAERADAVTPQAERIGERLVRSLQTDFKDVADELARVLAKPEAERAGAAAELLARVDDLVPDDPAMAEVIEEQMREAFDLQLKRQPEGDAPAANKAIPN